jgi:sec-independent protein translocase protein TatA
MYHMLALGMPGLPEWIIIAALGLLFFGKRLPEVGRSLGKGIIEFKKGLKGIEDEIDQGSEPARPQISQQAAAAPPHKFDPYTGKPVEAKAGDAER